MSSSKQQKNEKLTSSIEEQKQDQNQTGIVSFEKVL